ncbi:MAG: GAF domain-containing protein [Betaproteobacteria bacterium]|nr:GAF domain-containing protein [Betaproteobacteria bacterium]
MTPIELAALALVIAGAAATAWLVARLGTARAAEERARRYAERLALLQQVERGLVEHHRPEDIAAAALRPLRDLVGVPRAVVNLFDHEKGEAQWLAAIGRRRTRTGGVRYPLSLMGDLEALRRGEPQVVDSERLPPSEHRDALLASGVRAYMVVPMRVGDELIGALSFGGESADFPAEPVEIVREVAGQIGLAIHQARLHELVRTQAAELEARVGERTAELAARTAELERANAELEAFSYTVSHDLRAPLRAVDGFARIFEEDYSRYVDEEGRRLLGVIRESSRRMGTMIDSLLALSKLGRQPLHFADVDMTQLAAEAWVELAPDARVSCSLPALPSIRGDRALLKQVWTNLLGNAIKYSAKAGNPSVEVSGRREGSECVYCVADNGAGFDMRYAAKLFGVFQRLHGADEFPGTGVGLAIVQRIVSRHGGRTWAESEPERGARFYFSLPPAPR